MAANGEFSGMAALIRGLQNLPAQVQQEAEGVVQATASLMAAEVRRDYPQGETGNLRKGVVIKHEQGVNGRVRAQVRSVAKHAHLYEYGTVQRYTKGSGANRGTMPAQPTFVPAAVRNRQRMVEKLADVLRRTKVAGMDGSMEVR
jgi:HK97 gp10 family phage protein